jgi:hypothetical protein
MYTITQSNVNKDYVNPHATQYYLDMYGDFDSKLPDPVFYPSPERSDIFILDFAQGPCGLKAYGAEKFIAETPATLFGYASPRVGHAPEAVAMLTEIYNKKAVFFAAASKQVTPHQVVVLGYKGCNLRFARIPAMPTMNAWIRKWADEFGALALPFGLANTPEVTAGLVKMCDNHSKKYGEPTEFYCAVSTGTMIRALQIGWPNSIPKGVAVARNIKDGEKGYADVVSYHKSFYKPSDRMPQFNTTATYDAKAYDRFIKEGVPGSVFINVGSDKQIENRLSNINNWQDINSEREWGDQSAFDHSYEEAEAWV